MKIHCEAGTWAKSQGTDPHIRILRDYVWVGYQKGPCFGYVDSLADLRRLHTALGRVIRTRSRAHARKLKKGRSR
jgi:hypothetical protein